MFLVVCIVSLQNHVPVCPVQIKQVVVVVPNTDLNAPRLVRKTNNLGESLRVWSYVDDVFESLLNWDTEGRRILVPRLVYHWNIVQRDVKRHNGREV